MTDYQEAREVLAEQLFNILSDVHSNGWVLAPEILKVEYRTTASELLKIKWSDGSPMIAVLSKDQDIPDCDYPLCKTRKEHQGFRRIAENEGLND